MGGADILQDIATAMGGKVCGDRAVFPTPGHGQRDRGSWASVVPGAPDGVLIHSENGGDPLAIKDELRAKGVLRPREFTASTKPMFRQPRTPGVSYFEFCNAEGKVVCRKVRTDLPNGDKTFTWQHPDGKGGWASGRGCDPLLYRFPELLAAPTDVVVYVAEGERKADLLAGWGLVATSSKDLPDDLSAFAGRTVAILPDNDEQGATTAGKLQAALAGVAERVFQIKLPGLPAKGDVVDWAGNGGSAFELQTLVDRTLAPDLLPLADLDAWATSEPAPKAFVMAGRMSKQEITLLTGDGGTNKSTFGQQLAVCRASARPMLGVDLEPRVSLYVMAEDDFDRLHWMHKHICDAVGVSCNGLAGKLYLASVRGVQNNELATFDSEGRIKSTPAFAKLRATLVATGADLLVLDNVAHMFAGNENDRGQATAFVKPALFAVPRAWHDDPVDRAPQQRWRQLQRLHGLAERRSVATGPRAAGRR